MSESKKTGDNFISGVLASISILLFVILYLVVANTIDVHDIKNMMKEKENQITSICKTKTCSKFIEVNETTYAVDHDELISMCEKKCDDVYDEWSGWSNHAWYYYDTEMYDDCGYECEHDEGMRRLVTKTTGNRTVLECVEYK